MIPLEMVSFDSPYIVILRVGWVHCLDIWSTTRQIQPGHHAMGLQAKWVVAMVTTTACIRGILEPGLLAFWLVGLWCWLLSDVENVGSFFAFSCQLWRLLKGNLFDWGCGGSNSLFWGPVCKFFYLAVANWRHDWEYMYVVELVVVASCTVQLSLQQPAWPITCKYGTELLCNVMMVTSLAVNWWRPATG